MVLASSHWGEGGEGRGELRGSLCISKAPATNQLPAIPLPAPTCRSLLLFLAASPRKKDHTHPHTHTQHPPHTPPSGWRKADAMTPANILQGREREVGEQWATVQRNLPALRALLRSRPALPRGSPPPSHPHCSMMALTAWSGPGAKAGEGSAPIEIASSTQASSVCKEREPSPGKDKATHLGCKGFSVKVLLSWQCGPMPQIVSARGREEGRPPDM